MQKENLPHWPTEETLGGVVRPTQGCLGSLEVGASQKTKCVAVGLGPTAGVGVVPSPVFEVDGDFRNSVTPRQQRLTQTRPASQVRPLMQVGVAQHLPGFLSRGSWAHRRRQHGLIGDDVGEEVLHRSLGRVQVRVGVVAQRVRSGHPRGKHWLVLRVLGQLGAVDEAIHLRHVVAQKHIQHLLAEVHSREAGDVLPVSRQVIHRHRHFNWPRRGKHRLRIAFASAAECDGQHGAGGECDSHGQSNQHAREGPPPWPQDVSFATPAVCTPAAVRAKARR